MKLTDLEIAQQTELTHIKDIAKMIDLKEGEYEPYGNYKAKLPIDLMEKLKDREDGKVILVTAINPTPAGEGKSTTTIGLGQALHKINKNAIIALREPSLGPVMGVKGGAAGGGYSQVLPMEDINLHFTGDIHAITTANNTLSAIIDNHIHRGNELNIDQRKITWKRCVDINDRSLRNVTVGLGGKAHGIPREDGFNITVASEIMAVLCLSNNLEDLKSKLSEMLVAYSHDNKPIYVKDLKAEGALTLLLKDAIKPNLVQTIEKTPVLIHGGPFANIAHGCNSNIATKLAGKLGDYVVTEAGFGADLGAEKFLNIKCRYAEIKPSAVVIVATVRALKMHGGVAKDQLKEENVEALLKGVENLQKHTETINSFGLPYVIAINRFVHDTDAELKALEKWCKDNNHPVELAEVWEHGGNGGIDLAKRVVDLVENDSKNNYSPLYKLEQSIEEKIETIAKTVYGADGVDFTKDALKNLKEIKDQGWDKLAVCMAKTQNSLSDDAAKKGRPRNFRITVRELKPSLGAGFIVALTGNVLTMPGLPKVPAAMNMDVDQDGNAKGLF